MLKYFTFLSIFVVATVNCQSCDSGWVLFQGNCYNFLPNTANWTNSRTLCDVAKNGSDLALVKEANTLRDIYSYITDFALSNSYWLGGDDLDFEGDWHWVDNSRIDYGTPFWALNNGVLGWSLEPQGGSTENCLALNENRFYYFDDIDCNSKMHPLCMYVP